MHARIQTDRDDTGDFITTVVA